MFSLCDGVVTAKSIVESTRYSNADAAKSFNKDLGAQQNMCNFLAHPEYFLTRKSLVRLLSGFNLDDTKLLKWKDFKGKDTSLHRLIHTRLAYLSIILEIDILDIFKKGSSSIFSDTVKDECLFKYNAPLRNFSTYRAIINASVGTKKFKKLSECFHNFLGPKTCQELASKTAPRDLSSSVSDFISEELELTVMNQVHFSLLQPPQRFFEYLSLLGNSFRDPSQNKLPYLSIGQSPTTSCLILPQNTFFPRQVHIQPRLNPPSSQTSLLQTDNLLDDINYLLSLDQMEL